MVMVDAVPYFPVYRTPLVPSRDPFDPGLADSPGGSGLPLLNLAFLLNH